MKRVVLFVLVAATAFGAAQAAQLEQDPNNTGASGQPYTPLLPNITQNSDLVPTGGSIACGSSGIASDNHFLRRYFLAADHGIALQYNLTAVDIAIEAAYDYSTAMAGIPITVNAYSINNGAGFTFANMTMLDSTTVMIPDQTSLAIFNYPIGGAILDPAGQDLVVSIYNPDVTDDPVDDDFGYWPGSNGAGQTQPSYLASVGCAINEPLDIADIGYPNMHVIQLVYGDEAIVPTPTAPSGQQNPVPTMNRYGVIAMVVLLLGVAVLVLSRRH